MNYVLTKKNAPLVAELHPRSYTGFPFITLIQYRKTPMLTIVDNIRKDSIGAFIIELCGPENVDEELLITTADLWYSNNKNLYPVSVEFSKRGLTPYFSKIFRTLNIDLVSRVIGPLPSYPIDSPKNIRRKRKKLIPSSVEILEI